MKTIAERDNDYYTKKLKEMVGGVSDSLDELVRFEKITNDFDYRVAKADLKRLEKQRNITGSTNWSKAQKLSNMISEFEKRTMDDFTQF